MILKMVKFNNYTNLLLILILLFIIKTTFSLFGVVMDYTTSIITPSLVYIGWVSGSTVAKLYCKLFIEK